MKAQCVLHQWQNSKTLYFELCTYKTKQYVDSYLRAVLLDKLGHRLAPISIACEEGNRYGKHNEKIQ